MSLGAPGGNTPEKKNFLLCLPLKDLTITAVAAGVALVTYVSEVQYGTLEVGNRSSLWIKTEKGWQLKFHQGTKVEVD